jgi:DNA-binding NarL/FixJ family response regulator
VQGVATSTAIFRPACNDAGVPRLLIVDDNAGFRSRARAVLEAEGFEVLGEAATGAEGVAAAMRLKPEVVLLDVQLPDLDGFEIARQLAALDSGLEVVLTSSRDRSDYGSLVSESAVRGFIPKAELSGAAVLALLAVA